jgi:hypothetical protein
MGLESEGERQFYTNATDEEREEFMRGRRGPQ